MQDGNYRRIPLLGGNGQIRAETLVDLPDFEEFGGTVWRLATEGYASRPGHTLLLHREIAGLEPGDGLTVDHRNGDRLDNRRANLRVLTVAQNLQNRGYGYGISRYRGVTYDSRARPLAKRWVAQAKLAGTRIHIGRFATEEEAAAAATAWRLEHMPFTVER